MIATKLVRGYSRTIFDYLRDIYQNVVKSQGQKDLENLYNSCFTSVLRDGELDEFRDFAFQEAATAGGFWLTFGLSNGNLEWWFYEVKPDTKGLRIKLVERYRPPRREPPEERKGYPVRRYTKFLLEA